MMQPAGGASAALLEAVRFGRTDRIHTACASGAQSTSQDGWGWSPLHDAAGSGQVNTVRILVGTYHADVSLANKLGWTPLHWAAAHGHLQVVKALVSEFGASTSQQTKHGETALAVAKRLQQREVSEYLKMVSV